MTFDLFVAGLRFTVVTDDAGVLAMATVVRARWLFDAVRQRTLLAAALHIVHVYWPGPLAEVRHHTGLRLATGDDKINFILPLQSDKYQIGERAMNSREIK